MALLSLQNPAWSGTLEGGRVGNHLTGNQIGGNKSVILQTT